MARDVFHLCDFQAATAVQLIMNSDTDHETDALALICETNTRLCDQVEIFDAIATINTTNAAGSNPKPTAIGRFRRQLEEENEIFQSKDKQEATVPNTSSISENLGVPITSIQSSESSSKDTARRLLSLPKPRTWSPRESSHPSKEVKYEDFGVPDEDPVSPYSSLSPSIDKSETGHPLKKLKDEDFVLPDRHYLRPTSSLSPPSIDEPGSRVSDSDESKIEGISQVCQMTRLERIDTWSLT